MKTDTNEMHKALALWIEASANNTKGNTLIRSELPGRVCYGWNLKPNDSSEMDFSWSYEENKTA
jgi:hypothetical protein